MIPGSFEYHRPTSLNDALGMLASLGDDALLVAGGHSLIPMMKLRMAAPEHLIDLQDVQSLKSITISKGQVTLGAMVTQTELIASDELQTVCPIIKEASLQIADPQIRNLGTIGGNIANGDPGNDMPAVMQTLDATYVVASSGGEREIAARNFYEAAYFTDRNDDEIVTAIRFKAPGAENGSAYLKQKRKIGDYATAAAAVILKMSGDTCSFASIGLTNVADTPLWAEEASAILVGSTLDEQSIKKAVNAAKAITDPASDGRGSKEFRTHIAGIMVQRAILSAHSRAQ